MMKIYFIDGPINISDPLAQHCDLIVDAKDGYTNNLNALNAALSQDTENKFTKIYTNSIIALNNKYAWNEFASRPEIYIIMDPYLNMNINVLTDKEIKYEHNIMSMFMNGAFGNHMPITDL